MHKKHNNSHPDQQRRALFSAVIGTGLIGGLPESWVKPVIQTVLLPVHATTTEGPIAQPVPLVARLDGVVEGVIGTEFSVDASASTGPEGTDLSFTFMAQGACSLVSQSGSTALIRRNLIAGTCEVNVQVSDGSDTDDAGASAAVSGGPPSPP